ncbi:MAG: [protein-PII] uridylyltransferase [Alphaproteobacteria bacterium]|nr:[protein-PII] uridylyltransferase [Alphaproteobacteria bacterium]
MLSPQPLPPDPIQATAQLRSALINLIQGPTSGDDGPIPREAALGAFRRHLGRIQSLVRDSFDQGNLPGLKAARLLASLIDGMLGELYIYACDTSTANGGRVTLAMAATGGYGRGVLAPFSDIDLLFITEEAPTPPDLWAIEFVLYFLWDLGLKVGHATRSVPDCLREANGDITIRTSLLDARPLAGEAALFEDFLARFRAACTEAGSARFIAAKKAERDVRHRRFGDSAFVVEPNIKEGRGGLRDLHTLYWMSRYVFGTSTMLELADAHGPAGGIITTTEARLALRSWDFLWSLRFHLHYVAGRAEERLTFDLQPVVGARMGYTRHGRQDGVERFMRHYFLTAREVIRLTQVLEPALERAALGPPARAIDADAALVKAGFLLADGKLMPATSQSFHDEPIRMLRLLQIARDRGLKLHPLAVRALIRNERAAVALRGDQAAADIFLDLLCGRDAEHNRADGAVWMKVLNETGILGRMLPDWTRIVGQMQFDTYHIFTVDEHTIEAVRILNGLERGELAEIAPVASSLVDHLQSRRALYVAMLMHDICKGRGGDHSALGAELALEVGPALGLSAEETEMVSWLVLHHLLLSTTAFKRDIDDPKTILDLSEVIQSPERLRLLLVLTVADMRAVSPKVWNGWKATLLRELYARVAEVLAGGLSTTERDMRVSRAREAAAMMLDGWEQEDIDRFLGLGYPSYWLSFDPETHARHAHMIRDAESRSAPLTVVTQPLPARAVTEVTVYAADHAGLFSRIAGALAVAGASIVDARIHTLTNGMALDTFWVQDTAGGAFDTPHRLARLSVLIEQALSGRIRLAAEIKKASKMLLGKRMRAMNVPPRVVIDNHASNTYTVLEVNGRDRPGLLHDVTAAISEQGLQIASAHVTTYGMRAVDVFYVKNVFGLKVENERKLAQLRAALLGALDSPDEADPPPAAVPPRPRRRRASDAA